jgi:hypothetical protein
LQSKHGYNTTPLKQNTPYIKGPAQVNYNPNTDIKQHNWHRTHQIKGPAQVNYNPNTDIIQHHWNRTHHIKGPPQVNYNPNTDIKQYQWNIKDQPSSTKSLVRRKIPIRENSTANHNWGRNTTPVKQKQKLYSEIYRKQL